MGNKKQGLTHSQIIGIIWLSIVLLIAIGALFFSRCGGLPQIRTEATDTIQKTFLTQKEDSVYHSRRKSSRKHYTSTNYNRRNSQPRIDSTFYSNIPHAPIRQPLMVELNTADTLTLQLLHGIGPAYARRIANYRERLGGFVSTTQLLEVYGFTPELLAHIAPHITLDTLAIRHININTIELKQLIKHPYIEYYQARDIITLRNRGARFHSADDLRSIPSMADSTLQRLLPYIDFGETATTK